jgi:hypothetical protein
VVRALSVQQVDDVQCLKSLYGPLGDGEERWEKC